MQSIEDLNINDYIGKFIGDIKIVEIASAQDGTASVLGEDGRRMSVGASFLKAVATDEPLNADAGIESAIFRQVLKNGLKDDILAVLLAYDVKRCWIDGLTQIIDATFKNSEAMAVDAAFGKNSLDMSLRDYNAVIGAAKSGPDGDAE